MRRSLMLLATVAMMIGMVAAPAAADKPTHYRIPETGMLEWQDIDACTGLPMTVTVYLLVSEHQTHRNQVLTGIAKGYGTTSSGYVLSGSPDHLMIRDGGDFVVNGYNDRWVNPDTGAKMKQHHVIHVKDGVPTVEKFRSWCVGGPTIYGELPEPTVE